MKTIALLCVIAIGLAIATIYYIIPEKLVVSQLTTINCTSGASYRLLHDDENWGKWWPENDSSITGTKQKNTHILDLTKFEVVKKLTNGVDINIQNRNLDLASTLLVIPLPGDSIALRWNCTIPSGNNPFTRIKRYQEAKSVKNKLSVVSQSMKQFLEKKENVYDFTIQRTSIQDTLLIAATNKFRFKPSTKEVYDLLSKLENYINNNGAIQTGSPMTNTSVMVDSSFQLMVAIPVNKQLPGNGNIFPRKLIKGNYLMTEVQGGPYTIQVALDQLKLYAEDYRRTTIAIPFESLITNRETIRDTAQWKTRIFLPVM